MGSNLATDKQTNHSRGRLNNVIVTNVRTRGAKMSRIDNIQDQNDERIGAILARMIHWQTVLYEGESTGWNLAAMSGQDKAAAEKLWKQLEGKRADQGNENIGNEEEREA